MLSVNVCRRTRLLLGGAEKLEDSKKEKEPVRLSVFEEDSSKIFVTLVTNEVDLKNVFDSSLRLSLIVDE